jgi:SAM-dependent methyltransferase
MTPEAATQLDPTGNSAKDYCLQRVAELARARPDLVVVDLGCGDGRNVEPLLRAHPAIRYLGIDPSVRAIEDARRRLSSYDAELTSGRAYDVELAHADVVLSFSVLEHVYDREPYIRSIARNLKLDGVALVNYDAGHFNVGAERWKGPLRHALARLGRDARFQAPVREAELRRLVADAGLRIEEARFFSTRLKEVHRLVPEAVRPEFARRLLELELWLNEHVEYRDELAPFLRTRNVVLKRTESTDPVRTS